MARRAIERRRNHDSAEDRARARLRREAGSCAGNGAAMSEQEFFATFSNGSTATVEAESRGDAWTIAQGIAKARNVRLVSVR